MPSPTPQTDNRIASPVLAFTATRSALAVLLFRVSVLTTLTLGLYRFWGRTAIRRYLWARTKLLGEPLEYTGLATELVVGFLVALALLAPLGLGYSVIDTVVGPGTGGARTTLELIYYGVLFGLLQVARFRMWRYRLSRTSWRGIRFGLDGSTWQYLSLAFGWGVVTLLTFGLAYPWTAVALWRYRIQHSRLGTTGFNFAAAARPLVVPWLIAFVLPAVVLAICAANIGDDGWQGLAAGSGQAIAANGPWLLTAAAVAPAWMLAIGWYRLVQGRHFINGTSLGPCRLNSELRPAPLLGAAVLAWFLVGVVAAAALSIVILTAPVDATPESLIWPGAAAALAVLTLAPVIFGAIFRFALLRQLCDTTTATDRDALANAVQAAREAPRHGEGLADALDVGAI